MECNLRSSPSIGPWWPHSSTLTCSLSFWAYTACVFLLAIFSHYSNLTVQIFWIGLLDSLMTWGDALFVWILKSKPLQPELEFVCCCAFGFKFSQLVCCVSSPPATQSALAHPFIHHIHPIFWVEPQPSPCNTFLIYFGIRLYLKSPVCLFTTKYIQFETNEDDNKSVSLTADPSGSVTEPLWAG